MVMVMMAMAMAMTPALFGVAKDQGLDHHWNGLGIGKLFADIDKVKILEIYPIDGNDTRPRQKFFFYNISD